MNTKIYAAVAMVIAVLFTLILWLQFIGTQAFTIVSGVETAIVWIIGVAILSLASGLIGWLTDVFKAALGMDTETTDIFDAIGIAVTFLITIIMWFTFLGVPANFTIVGILDTSIAWIVIVLIISLGGVLIDFLRTKFFDSLPDPATAAKSLTRK